MVQYYTRYIMYRYFYRFPRPSLSCCCLGTALLLHAHVLFYTLGVDVWTEPTKILVLEILEIWRSESAKGRYEGALWDAGSYTVASP